jgi:hypothetical protein
LDNDHAAQQPVGGDGPPPGFSVRRWAAVEECCVRSTVHVGGGRPPLTSSRHSRMASEQPSKIFAAIRRVVSFLIGALMFLIVAPEFSGMPRAWIAFWTLFPFVPVLCVCFGAGRSRPVEGAGWFLHLTGAMAFLLNG